MSAELEAIIADQSETIDQLRAELSSTQADLTDAQDTEDPYWPRVYDRIRAAWDAWVFTELGTASPTPLDLEGRPELDALWQAIK